MKVDLKRGDRRIGEGIEAKNINNFGTKVKKERCEQLFFGGCWKSLKFATKKASATDCERAKCRSSEVKAWFKVEAFRWGSP